METINITLSMTPLLRRAVAEALLTATDAGEDIPCVLEKTSLLPDADWSPPVPVASPIDDMEAAMQAVQTAAPAAPVPPAPPAPAPVVQMPPAPAPVVQMPPAPAPVVQMPPAAPAPVVQMPPAAPAPAPAVEVDEAGLPWDERIHAVGRKKLKDGTWKYKRGVDRHVQKSVEAELVRAMEASKAAPAPAPVVQMPPAAPAPAPVVQMPPAAPGGEVTFVDLVTRIAAVQITPPELSEILKGCGVESLMSMKSAAPHLIPNVLARVNEFAAAKGAQ